MTNCKCSPDCEAVVKTAGRQYARGHSPASHKDYEKRAITTSKTMKKFYREGGKNAFKGKHHTERTKSVIRGKTKKWMRENKVTFQRALQKRSKNKHWLAAVRKNASLGGLARKGIRHTAIAKRRMSIGRIQGLASGRIRTWNKGKSGLQVAWNKGLTKVTDSRVRQLSVSVQKAYAEGRKKTVSAKKFRAWYVGPKGRIWMRSSWEVKFAKWLDKLGLDWQYEAKRFPITMDGWTQSYTPDFRVPKWDMWVEVKGQLDAQSVERYAAFHAQYPEERWTWLCKDQLKAMGVLKKAA